ncbi:hypothetical protein [Xenorhabdus littoralis]|uniref:hypothetical protein n=1 Tax=Xenorhabdus littoralis TaxID=2582835 RepID=UPI0029E7ECF8|nr:hypothetical protein [Xenorhabdus sp. psl]MDX7992684.1 hypothetical protein [Xenorhabdus sp. psl]
MGSILYNRTVINTTDLDFNVSMYSVQYPVITHYIKSRGNRVFDFSADPTITGITFSDSINTLQLEYFSEGLEEPNLGFYLQNKTIAIFQDRNVKFSFSLDFYIHPS